MEQKTPLNSVFSATKMCFNDVCVRACKRARSEWKLSEPFIFKIKFSISNANEQTGK